MTTLRDLSGAFVTCIEGGKYLGDASTVAEADGVWLDCPVCNRSHAVLIWFADRPRVPADCPPLPLRSIATGTTIDDLTLSPSVDVTISGVCKWHGWIKNGEVT